MIKKFKEYFVLEQDEKKFNTPEEKEIQKLDKEIEDTRLEIKKKRLENLKKKKDLVDKGETDLDQTNEGVLGLSNEIGHFTFDIVKNIVKKIESDSSLDIKYDQKSLSKKVETYFNKNNENTFLSFNRLESIRESNLIKNDILMKISNKKIKTLRGVLNELKNTIMYNG